MKLYTWADVRQAIDLMSPDQLNSNVAIEIDWLDEVYSGSLGDIEMRNAGEDHASLDEGHPMIFIR